jgi:hypothetical protein
MRLDALVTPRGNWIWRHLHHMGLSEDDEWLRRKAVLEMYGDDYVLVRVYARSHATDDDSIVEANPETIALSAQSAREYE